MIDKNNHVISLKMATYADESFEDTKSKDHVVLAQIPSDADMNWFFALRTKIPKETKEIKYDRFKKMWNQLGLDLQNLILRGISQALIVIYDSNTYQTKIVDDFIVPVVGKPRSMWPHEFSQQIGKHIIRWANREMIFDSPLTTIAYSINDFRLDADKLVDQLHSSHNVRIFTGRCTALYKELLDDENREKLFTELKHQGYYLNPAYVEAKLIYTTHLLNRIYDVGNHSSIVNLQYIKNQINKSLEETYHLAVSSDNGIIEEVKSEESPYIQAADIAAGFARQWYYEQDGIQKII
ncbi:MAG: DUF3800 domain-containing protein, partial [Bacteroidota bacterium]